MLGGGKYSKWTLSLLFSIQSSYIVFMHQLLFSRSHCCLFRSLRLFSPAKLQDEDGCNLLERRGVQIWDKKRLAERERGWKREERKQMRSEGERKLSKSRENCSGFTFVKITWNGNSWLCKDEDGHADADGRENYLTLILPVKVYAWLFAIVFHSLTSANVIYSLFFSSKGPLIIFLQLHFTLRVRETKWKCYRRSVCQFVKWKVCLSKAKVEIKYKSIKVASSQMEQWKVLQRITEAKGTVRGDRVQFVHQLTKCKLKSSKVSCKLCTLVHILF